MKVEIASPGWWGGRYEVPASSGGALFESAIVRSRDVRGVVVDEAGKPVEGATARAVRPRQAWEMEGVVTDAKGAFVIPDVVAKPGRAYARARGFAPTRIATADCAPARGLVRQANLDVALFVTLAPPGAQS